LPIDLEKFISGLESKSAFVNALKKSKNQVEIVIGFKDSKENVLSDAFEESSNKTAKLSKS
jgi:hypothetical protein